MKKLTINGVTPIMIFNENTQTENLVSELKEHECGFNLALLANRGGYFVHEDNCTCFFTDTDVKNVRRRSFRCLTPYIFETVNGRMKRTERTHTFDLIDEILYVEDNQSRACVFTFADHVEALKFYNGLIHNEKSSLNLISN